MMMMMIMIIMMIIIIIIMVKVTVIPHQAEVAQGVPGRLRPSIFLTFGTTYEPAAFTPG